MEECLVAFHTQPHTRGSMVVNPISSIPYLTINDSVIQKVYEQSDGKTKIVNNYYEVLLYNRLGIVQTVTNTHTISYLV